ncbi:golgin subfamily A member 2 isoform X3 [Alosa sapidissima]|uniref:golgin subfamily A member 2 isoform X3 n=1 Tax=Alosa sapidissima TaxID=34773 RepID=UPI001C09F106|nr:golgin subfamily A member 2 isoform X3 [Alosa sapidissima]
MLTFHVYRVLRYCSSPECLLSALKEFQQKSGPPPSSVGPKKKRKVKTGNQLDTSTPDRHSPDNAPAEMEARDSPVAQLQEEASGEAGRGSPVTVSNPASDNVSAINPECVSDATALQNCNQDTNCHENSTDENRPLSSTESLRQLSQQLNGLLSGSSNYVNGDGAPSPVNEKELEARNQELSAALDSSNLTNSQLSAQLQQLTQQSQELNDQLQKERKEFEQKCVKEQGAMREQLQVHIQTIGILVSEKTELQTALSYTQQAARQKSADAEELNNRLQASKQRVSELERTLSTVSTQQKQFDKHNKELEKERDSLRLEVFRLNNSNEEARQQSSELTEQLRQRVSENSSLTLELDDLRRRLEMADVMLQQFSNQSGHPSANQQVQLLMEEKHQLEAHAAQMNESVVQLQTERDQYALQIQEDGRVWKEKTEQLLSQVTMLSEERDRSSAQIQELEAQISELRSSAAVLHEQQQQASVDSAPSGPSETEQALQEALNTAQQERDALSLQYQAQVRDNEQLSRLCQEQETRMEELERETQRSAEEVHDRRRVLEDAQSDKATISRALAQNRELKDQLAELQNGFVKLTNENMELTSALQSELHVKKELARRMGQLQEDLHNGKEQLEERSAEVLSVCEQRDQYAAHLQQYSSGYQQLVGEREELHKRVLQQAQLMDRLQHEQVQGQVQLQQSHQQLQDAQEKLTQLARDNEQLKSEVQDLLNGSALTSTSRDQGDGLESQSLAEGAEKSVIAIPEDFDSREEMEEFLQSVLFRVESERDELRRLLDMETRLHQTALQQVAALSQQQQQAENSSSSPNVSITNMGDAGGVPVEVHEALRVAMEKLQERFTSVMQEKADLKERMEELEHRCIQLSGETDTIGEYIALYQNQRAIMKQRHIEKEHYISMLAKDKEEMKAKLAELQDLVMRLVGERNEWYTRYVSAVSNEPHSAPHGTDTEQQAAHRRMELNAVDGPESMDMSSAAVLDPSPESSEEPPLQQSAADGQLMDSAPLRPKEDGTARQIMQLLQEIQNPQARPAPFLGENPCIPFFYRPDEHDEVKILVV